MTSHEDKVKQLKERKFNSSFSEARRSLITLFSFKVKSDNFKELSDLVYKDLLKKFNQKPEELSLTSEFKTFDYDDISPAGNIKVSVKVNDLKITDKIISFSFEGITDRKLVSMTYSFIKKKNSILVNFTEHILNDISWDNIKGRIARFFYIRELKKRQKQFVEFLRKNNFKARRIYSLLHQIIK